MFVTLDDTGLPPSVLKTQPGPGGSSNNGMFPGPAVTKKKIPEKCEEKHYSMKEIEKCDRFCDIKEPNSFSAGLSRQTANNSRNSQSIANCLPNNSFLWTKANKSDPNQSEKSEDVYDDVKNCPTYSEIRQADIYDDIKQTYATVSKSSNDLTQAGKKSHIFNSADNLENITYDDVENVANTMNTRDERNDTFVLPDLVTATPAVILEDGFDSLNLVYDNIKRDKAADEVTLYESIAGSLLRLDNLQVDMFVAILEMQCYKLAKIINEVSHKMPANNCCVERYHF